jgi:hypothetical protein
LSAGFPEIKKGVGAMKRARKWEAVVALFLASALMGSVGQLGCVQKVVNNFNPCGTILNCDAAEYDLMMHDFPDWDLDPTCTIPGQCGGVFPFNTTGTSTTTTGTTTTTTTDTTTGTSSTFPFF